MNEAALLAARHDKDKIALADLEMAKDKVMMGSERRSMIISDEEKNITAVHEAGHTLVAKLLPEADPIHKVTIIPRGRALGLTQQLPTDERHTMPKSHLLAMLKVLMGGRAAEELLTTDKITTGAGNDLERATDLARRMVCDWGMSETMGPLTFGKKEEQIFLGREISQHRDYSERTAQMIDEEVKKFVLESYDKAKQLLLDNVETLRDLSSALLERGTLSGDEVDVLIEKTRKAAESVPSSSEDDATGDKLQT